MLAASSRSASEPEGASWSKFNNPTLLVLVCVCACVGVDPPVKASLTGKHINKKKQIEKEEMSLLVDINQKMLGFMEPANSIITDHVRQVLLSIHKLTIIFISVLIRKGLIKFRLRGCFHPSPLEGSGESS